MKSEKKAVAVTYSNDAEIPFIAASAKGLLAERMLSIAETEKIPIVHDENLSEILSLQEIGTCIPEETWIVMAKIFAFIKKFEERNE